MPRPCKVCGAASQRGLCKVHRKNYDAKYFEANAVVKTQSATARKRDILTWYRKLKDGKPCQAGLQGCSGGPYHFCQLDFDHIPGRGSKFMDVSKMVRLGYEKSKIQAEIEKCQLICKNCHSMRTMMRIQGKKIPNSYE